MDRDSRGRSSIRTHNGYVAMSNGRRFLAAIRARDPHAPPITIVVSWAALLCAIRCARLDDRKHRHLHGPRTLVHVSRAWHVSGVADRHENGATATATTAVHLTAVLHVSFVDTVITSGKNGKGRLAGR